MSGHSKWANIKRKKEANDKVKGTVFAKLSRNITLAVIEGGGMTSPDANFKLRLAIDKAKAENMPKDNIQRAIEKGHGPGTAQLKEIIYEAFGPHGVAYMIKCTTDNSTRTHNEVRGVLENRGGKMGSQGSVAYLFQKCAVMQFDLTNAPEDAVFAFAEAVHAYDIDEGEGTITVYFPFEEFGHSKEALGTLSPTIADIEYRGLSKVGVASHEEAQKVIDLAEAIEDLGDVQHVYTNLE